MMILTVMRRGFKKFQPRIINYRYRKVRLSQENFVNNDDGFERFCDMSLSTLNKHAPSKIKHVRSNQMPFYDKGLPKAIMT